MAPHYEIYPEQAHASGDASELEPTGLWRWRFVAGNGENTANGSEGYADEGNVRRAVIHHAELVVEACCAPGAVLLAPPIKVVDK